MNEYDAKIDRLPASSFEEFDVANATITFSEEEINSLSRGHEVVREIAGDRFFITAPIEWAVLFDSQVPALRDSLLTGFDREELEARAVEFREQKVSSENCWRHSFRVVPLASVPAWHGQQPGFGGLRRREKDDVCAWEGAQGF